MKRFLSRAAAILAVVASTAFAAADAHADKLADILQKGVVRIIVFGDVRPSAP